jgi:hypothetical protein
MPSRANPAKGEVGSDIDDNHRRKHGDEHQVVFVSVIYLVAAHFVCP